MASHTAGETRARIVAAADRLVYERGFDHTSFADVAAAVGLSRGNFYYHFRTKDEILDAVIEARLAGTRAMLAEWERQEPTPVGRVRRFARIVIANGPDIRLYGCPLGTLTAELAKLRHPARPQALALFDCFRTWLREQFDAIGVGDHADACAMHVLVFSQGAATLSNAYGDDAMVECEVASLESWLAGVVHESSVRP